MRAVPSVNKEWSIQTRSQFGKKSVVCTVTYNNNDEVNRLHSGKSHDGGTHVERFHETPHAFKHKIMSGGQGKDGAMLRIVHVLFMIAMHKQACIHTHTCVFTRMYLVQGLI